jgi:hypothetical protein
VAYDDSEARDDQGRWTSGGGGGFPTEADLTAKVGEEAAARDVWAGTSAGGLGLNFDSNAEGRAYLESHEGEPVAGHEAEQAQNLSEVEQKQSISGYQDGQFHSINDPLRADTEPQPTYQADITHLDDSIAQQMPTSADTVVYRGYTGLMPPVAGLPIPPDYTTMEPGETFTDKGFVSASTDQSVAEQFSRRLGTENPNTGTQEKPVMAIHVPEGSQGLNVNGLLPSSGEDEIILPRGSEFQVLSREGLVTHVALLPTS